MPNNDPANPSGQDDGGAEPNASPNVNADAGGANDGASLDELVKRGVQGMVDRDIALLKEGRTDQMDPKIQQILSEYTKLLGTPAGGADNSDDDDDSSSYLDPRKPAKKTRLEQIGEKALQQELLGKMQREVETKVIAELWADDLRALFADLKDVKLDTNDPLVQRIASVNRYDQLYSHSKDGWSKWRQDARELRRNYMGPASSKGAGSEDAGDGDTSGSDADRARGQQTKRPPNPGGSGGSSGTGLAAVVQASKDLKAKKITTEQYLEILNKNKTV